LTKINDKVGNEIAKVINTELYVIKHKQ